MRIQYVIPRDDAVVTLCVGFYNKESGYQFDLSKVAFDNSTMCCTNVSRKDLKYIRDSITKVLKES